MKKDIFIDNNIACKFSNPQDKEYIKLTTWLLKYNQGDKANIENYAHLVVSKKILNEYLSSARGALCNTSIPMIINKLLSEGRLIFINNEQIKAFKSKFYTKLVLKKLRSNMEDREHIPLVLLSDRKFALTYDDNLIFDLKSFTRFNVRVEKRPENIPYSK